METIVNYLLQSGLSLLVLYLFYRLALRNQPSLRYNRLFLLLAPLVALAAPLLRIPLPFAENLPIAAALPAFQLGEVVVVAYHASETSALSSLSVSTVLLALYTLVGLVLLGRLAWQLLQVHRMATTALPLANHTSGATVLQTDAQHPTFAFLRYVFLSHQPHLSAKEQQQVLAHELAHVRLRHTCDILYYEVLTALLWFNPLLWLLKEELRDVHEYQADAHVLSEYQPQEYSALLAKEALYTAGIPVGSYFQKPQVFRRLRMLQQYGRKQSLLRPLLVLPLLLLLLVAFSVRPVNADRTTLLEGLAPLGGNRNNISLQQAEKATNDEQSSIAQAKTYKPEALPDQTEPPKQEKVRPYTHVEQMPEFKDGESEMLKFLGTNIRYPKAMQDASIQGLVVLQFTVETDGSLKEMEVLKSLHEDADQEAIRVVKAMSGNWKPGIQNGKPVPVRYTMPIKFAIK